MTTPSDPPAIDDAFGAGTTAGDDAPGAGSPAAAASSEDLAPAPCPYLAAPGGWRSTGAAREHRCTALDPAPPLSLDKQRRLCLVAAHRACPTFVAARSAREKALAGVPAGWEPARPLVRTAPVVVEAAPRRRTVPISLGTHRLAEGAVALMAVVVVVLIGSRVLGGAQPEPTPRPTAVATAAPTDPGLAGAASATPTTPSETAASSDPSSSAGASAAPTERPTPKPSPAGRTYTVKSGDTLSGIAAKFGVTWQAIAKANKIKSPYRIVRGQVLQIPPAQ